MKLIVVCWISALISSFPAYAAESTTDPSYETRQSVQYGVARSFGVSPTRIRMHPSSLSPDGPPDDHASLASSRLIRSRDDFSSSTGATYADSSVPCRAEISSFRRNNPEGWRFRHVDNPPHHAEQVLPAHP